jgi:hypothetical protein
MVIKKAHRQEALMSAGNKSDDPGKFVKLEALLDEEPPGRRLHVKGTWVYPTAGWTISLEKATPQGVNPAVLILKKIAKAPQGQAAQQETTYEPKYDHKLEPGEPEYETVTVMPDNVSKNIDVAH